MSTNTRINLHVELTEDQAEALGQMCKRFSWETAKQLSNAFDGGRERDLMIDGVCVLSRALADKGFKPR